MNKIELSKFADIHNEFDEYQKSLENVSTFTDCPEVDRNVFACLLEDKVVEKEVVKGYSSKKARHLQDGHTGEVIKMRDRSIFYEEQFVDNDKYVKLYMDGWKRWFDLSHNAYKVFFYFIREIQKDKDADIVHFSMQDCMEQCGYKTHPMVYRALTELILKEFICKSSKYKFAFYVNPTNICNGKRTRFVLDVINRDADDNVVEEESGATDDNALPESSEANILQDNMYKLGKETWED